MEIIVGILSAVNLISLLIYGTKILNVRKSEPTLAPAQSSISTPDHYLKRTWIGSDPHGMTHHGWRWECSCGVKGTGGADASKIGSEEIAINRFKMHAKLYREVNGAGDTELDKLRKEFAEYKEKCYCKDTNDDLILMNAEKK